jgi:hypothetical protein
LSQLRLPGRNLRFIHIPSPVQLAINLVKKPIAFGLIVERRFSLRITAKNGRNFITANVVKSGGHGAAIDPPLNSEIESLGAIVDSIRLIPLTIFRI